VVLEPTKHLFAYITCNKIKQNTLKMHLILDTGHTHTTTIIDMFDVILTNNYPQPFQQFALKHFSQIALSTNTPGPYLYGSSFESTN
jgi:hypothetical protein